MDAARPATAPSAREDLRLLFWETTTGCNLACLNCLWRGASRTPAPEDLTTEEALDLVDQITGLGRPLLVLSGGEPLVRPDILELVRHATDRGLTVWLATNGTGVTSRMARALRAAGVARCAVGLDGARGETHDRFRFQLGSFHRALEGIAYLRWAGIPVQITTTVARHNADEVEEIYDLAMTLGAVGLHAGLAIPVGCPAEIAEDLRLSGAAFAAVFRRFCALARRGQLRCGATYAPEYAGLVPRWAAAEDQVPAPGAWGDPAPGRGHLAESAVCVVAHEGSVFPRGAGRAAGNIRRAPFKTIWERSLLPASPRGSGASEPQGAGGDRGLLYGGRHAWACPAPGDSPGHDACRADAGGWGNLESGRRTHEPKSQAPA